MTTASAVPAGSPPQPLSGVRASMWARLDIRKPTILKQLGQHLHTVHRREPQPSFSLSRLCLEGFLLHFKNGCVMLTAPPGSPNSACFPWAGEGGRGNGDGGRGGGGGGGSVGWGGAELGSRCDNSSWHPTAALAVLSSSFVVAVGESLLRTFQTSPHQNSEGRATVLGVLWSLCDRTYSAVSFFRALAIRAARGRPATSGP